MINTPLQRSKKLSLGSPAESQLQIENLNSPDANDKVKKKGNHDLMKNKGSSCKDKKHNFSRRNWDEEEDEAIEKLVEEFGTKEWTHIAKKMNEIYKIKGRTGKQCRERWHNHINPHVIQGKITTKEETMIFEGLRQFGTKWAEIAKTLPGRTDNIIKNHFYSILRKQFRRIKKRFKLDTPDSSILNLKDFAEFMNKFKIPHTEIDNLNIRNEVNYILNRSSTPVNLTSEQSELKSGEPRKSKRLAEKSKQKKEGNITEFDLNRNKPGFEFNLPNDVQISNDNHIAHEKVIPKFLKPSKTAPIQIPHKIMKEEPRIFDPEREKIQLPDLKIIDNSKLLNKDSLESNSEILKYKQNSSKKKSEEVNQRILDKVSQQCQSRLSLQNQIEEEFSFKNINESKNVLSKEKKGFRDIIGFRAPELRIFPTSYDSMIHKPIISNKKSPNFLAGFSPITTPLDQLNALYRNTSNRDLMFYDYEELRSANMNNIPFKPQFTPQSFY